ncbi:MAG: AraC family transcriptional regulator, partial [Acidobacteriota bacterium]
MSHLVAAAVFDRMSTMEYSLAAEVFGQDRRLLTPDWYDFLPCRVEPGRLRSGLGLDYTPAGALGDLAAADTILITGWREPVEEPPEALLEALRAAHARGARLVSICTGAFVLAYAGLLDGRRATTHWLHARKLRRLFPRVEVDEQPLYIHDRTSGGQISTSAGSVAGLDLCLALVREDHGVAVANVIARRLV